MTPAQFKKLSNKAKVYFSSLDLQTVKQEFLADFLLNQNKKLEKGDGVLNYGLELTPSKFCQDEMNMCGSEGKCLFTCLAFSGIDNMMKSASMELSSTLKKRIRRTFLFLKDQTFFLTKLEMEIKLLSFMTEQVAIRMNVFSDVNWEEIFDLNQFSNVIFYDYTKKIKNIESTKKNFTYSASEKDKDSDLVALLERGMNVAMVFGSKLPQEWKGFEVVDGDIHDRRYEDKKGVVVGLRQKTTMGGKSDSVFIKKAS
jgi:hypothetical protein